jgi:hypothetical protein
VLGLTLVTADDRILTQKNCRLMPNARPEREDCEKRP